MHGYLTKRGAVSGSASLAVGRDEHHPRFLLHANDDQLKHGRPPVRGLIITPGRIEMAKGEQKGNREAKKPKKEKIKVIAAAPSQKIGGWQPTLGSGKKK
jgi:hypothetical protein